MYISSGEVAAKERITEWFREVAGKKIHAQASHLTTEPQIRQTAPILFGTPRTNKHIRSLYAMKHSAHFCYRFPDTPNYLDIYEASKRFIDTLAADGAEQFSETSVRIPYDGTDYVFGVVTRLPNPSGTGTITMIQCDHPRAIEQMAHTLTDDQLFNEQLSLMHAVWRSFPFPACFEWLFYIPVSPDDIDYAAQKPHLAGYRAYDGSRFEGYTYRMGTGRECKTSRASS